MEREQQQRERAYKIWESEGRPESQHEDHWRRAQEQSGESEQQAADITEANQDASDKFNGSNNTPKSTGVARPPSTVSPD